MSSPNEQTTRPYVRVRDTDGDEHVFVDAQFIGIRTGVAVIKKKNEAASRPQDSSGLWSSNGSFSLHFLALASIDRLEIGSEASGIGDTASSLQELRLFTDLDDELKTHEEIGEITPM